MMPSRCLSLFATMLLLAAPIAAAVEQDMVRRAVEAGQLMPLKDILGRVQGRYPGKVLDVELDRDPSGRRIYEIKILQENGRRKEVHVDAVTGLVLDDRAAEIAVVMPLPQVLRAVLERYPGHVLDVELDQNPGEPAVYEVRIAQAGGRQVELLVDARSGQIVPGSELRSGTLQWVKPLPDVLDLILALYRGVILEAELEFGKDDRPYYEVEVLLSDGRKIEVHVDALTGELLRQEGAE
ncbi:PepSY domain-containing protein [Thauera sp. Sel9]|uniref:PepSY domain-containing protein n=1 Tax=Thauera sp. Sel9 TaxID=2974299 RepID=UPI0021E170EA|nr:PepSY domain-containing protein [Thauera sp. Sel9]MCV2216416.1 PepSY domain-containing protein [Thauera sp. Sel9]